MKETPEEQLQQLSERVQELVSRPNYQPVKPKALAKKLRLDEEQAGLLKRVIKRLIRDGKLMYESKHRIRLAKGIAVSENVRQRRVGKFRRIRNGDGFVILDAESRTSSRDGDIYVPATACRDAAPGDRVAVNIHGKRRRGGRQYWTGSVVEIVSRAAHQFVGTYRERNGWGQVDVDNRVFAEPVDVGDPGAKGAVPGDKVVVEMVRFPTPFQAGEGVLLEVLGKHGAPGVDTLLVMREFQLPDEFPEEVLDDARAQAALFSEEITEDRRDLTAETIITIDPTDARDFDDAISLEETPEGHLRLGVHIADVAHFVPAGSILDQEARERATSVYLPDRVIPMLPEIISNNLASLQPDRVRYTKSVFMDFTPEGTRVHTEFCRGAIRSCRRFTYEEVDEFLQDRDAWEEKLAPKVFALLQRMYTLAMTLRRRRKERGALELTLPAVKIDLDQKGRVKGAHLELHTESHQIIEEFMLAANEAVADQLTEREIVFLRRIHESPDPRRLRDVTLFVRELGIPCDSLESRFEIQRVIDEVASQPQEHAINFAILRSLQKARYGPEVEGHFALHSENYCHFTSPIRRYPDLTIHRIMDALVEGKNPVTDFDKQMSLGDHCSEREQRAETAERELTKLKLLNFLSQHIGQKLEAVITGVERFGLFAQGLSLPAEGLISIDSLEDDHYDYDRTAHTLSGRRSGNQFRLGDQVEVEVARVDLDERVLDFRLVEPRKSGRRTKPRQTRQSAGTAEKRRRSGKKHKPRKHR